MVKVTGNITFNVDPLEAGNIVAQVLMDDYVSILKDITELTKKSILSDVEEEDLDNNYDVTSAMAVLLAYYLPHGEFVDFMEKQRNNTNG